MHRWVPCSRTSIGLHPSCRLPALVELSASVPSLAMAAEAVRGSLWSMLADQAVAARKAEEVRTGASQKFWAIAYFKVGYVANRGPFATGLWQICHAA